MNLIVKVEAPSALLVEGRAGGATTSAGLPIYINNIVCLYCPVYIKNVCSAMVGFAPEQCRAARAMKAWSQRTLAKKSRVAQKTIADFELGETSPREGTLQKLKSCLEAAGVEFIDANGGGPGVRLRSPGR